MASKTPVPGILLRSTGRYKELEAGKIRYEAPKTLIDKTIKQEEEITEGREKPNKHLER